MDADALAALLDGESRKLQKMSAAWVADAQRLGVAEMELAAIRNDLRYSSPLKKTAWKIAQRIAPATYGFCRRERVRPVFERKNMLRELREANDREFDLIDGCQSHLHRAQEEFKKYRSAR